MDWTHGLDSRTGVGKIVHNVFQYHLYLFWNHLTYLVRITGIACVRGLPRAIQIQDSKDFAKFLLRFEIRVKI